MLLQRSRGSPSLVEEALGLRRDSTRCRSRGAERVEIVLEVSAWGGGGEMEEWGGGSRVCDVGGLA